MCSARHQKKNSRQILFDCNYAFYSNIKSKTCTVTVKLFISSEPCQTLTLLLANLFPHKPLKGFYSFPYVRNLEGFFLAYLWFPHRVTWLLCCLTANWFVLHAELCLWILPPLRSRDRSSSAEDSQKPPNMFWGHPHTAFLGYSPACGIGGWLMNRSYSKNTYISQQSLPQASQLLQCSMPVVRLFMGAVNTALQSILSETRHFHTQSQQIIPFSCRLSPPDKKSRAKEESPPFNFSFF